MINRRSLVAGATLAAAVGMTASRTGLAQETELPLQNASFIRDLAAGATPVAATPVAATPMVSPQADIDFTTLRGYILGDPAAPNTLQIFSDYRCPHCRVFHAEIEPGLLADFVTAGTLNLELMDFTVIGVPSFDALGDDTIESVQAAEAAACAAEQNAYLPYREWLFSGELQTSDGDFADDNLIAAAEELGLDTGLFAASLLGGVYEPGIIAMVTAGLNADVHGTPTMILNGGEPFFTPEGGYPELKELLESEMS